MTNQTKKISVVDSILLVFKVTDRKDRKTKKNVRKLQFKPFIIMGYLKGAPVPLITFALLKFAIAYDMSWLFIIATFGLVFSCITVVMWGAVAFGGRFIGWMKAIGFVGLIEGAMTALCWVPSVWALAISLLCLALLVFINGTATTCNLILDSKAARSAARGK